MENIEIKQLDNSEIEITASIGADEFDSYHAKALKALGKDVKIDGFRQGNVPDTILEQKVGEASILHEMANMAIAEFYPKLVIEKKLEVIGRPEIMITKMAKGNPLEFKAKTAVMPEINLPDYKEIAEKIMSEEDEIVVDEIEIEKTIQEIRTNWAHQMAAMKKKVSGESKDDEGEEKKGKAKTSEAGSSLGDGAPDKPDQTKSDLGEKEKDVKKDEKLELPPFNDEFVKQLGAFENIAEFKEKLKKNIREEKMVKANEKKRLTIVEDIIEKASFSPPQVLVDGELERMMVQFKDNVAMMGQKPEDYFTQIKKTEDEVKKGWSNDAIKRVQTQLILHKIAELEKIEVKEDDLKKEVKVVLEKYPGAEEARARSYVENIMINEKVFEFLEGKRSETTEKTENKKQEK